MGEKYATDMVDKKIALKMSNGPSVVGTIHSDASLKAALRLSAGTLDFLEVRVDSFIKRENELLEKLPKLKLPLIITVRHPLEGGVHRQLSMPKRRDLYKQFLSHATAIDIELRSAESLKEIIGLARIAKVKVILSYHDFRGTPGILRLSDIAVRARKYKGDMLKVACVAKTALDVNTLLAFQAGLRNLPLSVMGMGAYGKISRLLFAKAGSVLNYGFLGEAQVSGQWPAALLKERIAEL